LIDFLPPDGKALEAARKLAGWVERSPEALPAAAKLPVDSVELLLPIPRPNKLFLLAGNYAEHIREGGGTASERDETFPYVFMKPPSTTLVAAGKPVKTPRVSPEHIDYELELAVVIGRGGKAIAEESALSHVAGYTVVNDISDRKFRPNPGRKERPNNSFFDWQHGKWHDSFCPCGPCVTSADAIADPQKLAMKLRVNGRTRQDASTGQMIFPVAAVIAFISSFVTLEPGDIIATGTPAGVGVAVGRYLEPGDVMVGTIEGLGTLTTPVVGS
jgi:2,4-didehydro-3-deoxy-L-rhamnonate hydrolase